MIRLENVWKSFNERTILKGISFTVEKGETFVIIGLSGTGKTVSLKHIAGFIEPDSGKVLINGKNMSNADNRKKTELRQKMGMVFQSGALLNWMTV